MGAEFQPSTTKKLSTVTYLKLFLVNKIFKIVKKIVHLFTGQSAIERLLVRYAKFQAEIASGEMNEDKTQLILKNKTNTSCTYLPLKEQINFCNELLQLLKDSRLKLLQEAYHFLTASTDTKNKNKTQNSYQNTDQICSNIVNLKINNHFLLKNKSIPSTIDNLLWLPNQYRALKFNIRSIQKERYDSENQVHEDKLRKIWDLTANNDEKLTSRISEQWKYLGFQGTDPATDFRGMGRLGLENMLYFCQNHPDIKKFILEASHPKTGYPFAMLVINLTALLVELLEADQEMCKNYIYRRILSEKENIVVLAESDDDDLEKLESIYLSIFCQIFTEVLLDFKKNYWIIENETDVFKFNQVRENYKRLLETSGHIFEI